MNKLKNIMLILISCLVLVACSSSEYDQAIDEVIQLENKYIKDDDAKKYITNIDRKDCNIFVYEKGNLIVVVHNKYIDKEDKNIELYVKNVAEDTYKHDSSSDNQINKYMIENEPDYKEINIK